jgi:hypothetical protein
MFAIDVIVGIIVEWCLSNLAEHSQNDDAMSEWLFSLPEQSSTKTVAQADTVQSPIHHLKKAATS